MCKIQAKASFESVIPRHGDTLVDMYTHSFCLVGKQSPSRSQGHDTGDCEEQLCGAGQDFREQEEMWLLQLVQEVICSSNAAIFYERGKELLVGTVVNEHILYLQQTDQQTQKSHKNIYSRCKEGRTKMTPNICKLMSLSLTVICEHI